MEHQILLAVGFLGLALHLVFIVFAAVVARFIIGVIRRQREMDREFDAHWERRRKEPDAFKREFDRRFRFNRTV